MCYGNLGLNSIDAVFIVGGASRTTNFTYAAIYINGIIVSAGGQIANISVSGGRVSFTGGSSLTGYVACWAFGVITP